MDAYFFSSNNEMQFWKLGNYIVFIQMEFVKNNQNNSILLCKNKFVKKNN